MMMLEENNMQLKKGKNEKMFFLFLVI